MECNPSPTHLPKLTAGNFFSRNSSFLDDRLPVEGDSPSAHVAIDNSVRARQEAGPTTSRHAPGLITPYFPAGLAKMPEEPTVFNFGLFLFDNLCLPRGLFRHDRERGVQFADLEECREYCEAYVAEREGQCQDQAGAGGRTRQREGTLSKPEMFHRAGQALSEKMTTGNELFDGHLDDLRLDDFGNVMHLHAPFWSDISAQFMHGFPRRLITDSHGGVLPGNITVAARISNQAVRSLSIGKMNSPKSVHIYTGAELHMLTYHHNFIHIHTHIHTYMHTSLICLRRSVYK